MAHEQLRHADSYFAASTIDAQSVVSIGSATGILERSVHRCVAATDEPLGVTIAPASYGLAVVVYDRGNTVKVTAAASLGAGADIGITSASSSVGPVAAAASGAAVKWRVGKSLTSAVAGDVFSLYVDPAPVNVTQAS